MTKSFQSRPFVALLALVVTITTGACSQSPTAPSPTQPGSAVKGAALTVRFSGKVAGNPVALSDGSVDLYDSTGKVLQTKMYQDGGTTFDNLPQGEYSVSGQAFGFERIAPQKVSVGAADSVVDVELTPSAHAIKFLGLYVKGQKLLGTEVVPTPVDLEVRVLTMNASRGLGSSRAYIQTQEGTSIILLGQSPTSSAPFEDGLREVSIVMKGFRPCNLTSGKCFQHVNFVSVRTGPLNAGEAARDLAGDITYNFEVDAR